MMRSLQPRRSRRWSVQARALPLLGLLLLLPSLALLSVLVLVLLLLQPLRVLVLALRQVRQMLPSSGEARRPWAFERHCSSN